MDTFDRLLDLLSGKTEVVIKFTRDNIDEDDRFLIQVYYYDKTEVITLKRRGIWMVEFECDEPIRLEECPESFWKSIIKNLEMMQ